MNLIIKHGPAGWPSRLQNAARRGVIAIEFALSLPIWIALFMGSSELALLLLQSERVDRISYSITDIVTQSQLLTRADLAITLSAASQLMNPFPFGERGAVIVSSIYKPPGQPAVIKWQYTGGGSLSIGSKIGAVNGQPQMPEGLVLNDKDNVIATEVFYAYEPMFAGFGIFEAKDLYRVAVYKPRLSPLITPPS